MNCSYPRIQLSEHPQSRRVRITDSLLYVCVRMYYKINAADVVFDDYIDVTQSKKFHMCNGDGVNKTMNF